MPSTIFQRGGRSVRSTVDSERLVREAEAVVAAAGDAILGTATAPSGSEAVGDRWLVVATASGDFSSMEGQVATRVEGGWTFRDAIAGERFSIAATRQVVFWDATSATLRPLNAPHSTTEQDTGALGPAGNRVWRKLIAFGALPNNTTKSVAHGISSMPTAKGAYVRIGGSMSDGTTGIALPTVAAGASRNIVELRWDATNVIAQTNYNASGSDAVIELVYER